MSPILHAFSRHLRRRFKRPHLVRWLFRCCLLLVVVLVWRVDPAAAQPVGQDAPITVHVVRYGETLSEIAQAYGLSLDALMARNGLSDADAIRVGERLVVPVSDPAPVGRQTGAAEAAPETAAASRIVSLNRTVTVRAGDTLGWIALRYGVDQSALQALNGLTSDNNAIVLGQVLLLPATADDLRVAAPDSVYIVQRGDSLGRIAQANGVSLQELMVANRIDAPDTIRPGQQLTIPGPVRQGRAPSVGPARAGYFYHDVRPGETMSELSQQFATTPQAIVRYNSLPDEQTIFAGLEVRIPYGPPVLDRRRPPTPQSGTEFVISITRQRCWLMQNGSPLYDWKCSTGQGQWATRTGAFPIKTKLEMAQSSAYRLDMPFWLGLYDVGDFENGIHGLPVEWDTGQKLWDTLVGQPATFGCAMLLDEDAATLFRLAYLGMPVHIVD